MNASLPLLLLQPNIISFLAFSQDDTASLIVRIMFSYHPNNRTNNIG